MAEFCAFQKLARLLLLDWQGSQRAIRNAKVQETIMFNTANFRSVLFAGTFALISSILLVVGTASAPMIA